MKNKKLIGSIMLLLAAMLWGGSYAIQKMMSENIGTFAIIFLKGFSGYLILFFCFIFNRKINKKTVLGGMLIGMFNGLGLILQQTGLSISDVSKVSFISGLYIIFVPLFRLFAGKKPKPRFWAAVLIACVGMYMLCMTESLSISFGDLITLISTMFFALQIIFIDKYSKDVDFVPFCGVQQATTSLMCGILMLIIERPNPVDFTNIILPIIYTMFISGMVAQLLQNKYQKDVDPTVASLIMSLESVFGALSGVLLLHTSISSRELIGCILIFISILVAQ